MTKKQINLIIELLKLVVAKPGNEQIVAYLTKQIAEEIKKSTYTKIKQKKRNNRFFLCKKNK
jgi:hypothetical protein